MEYVDMTKLETALTYIQRIADGNNPVNNNPAEEDSILNNPNVIRCMFFVKEVLEEVKNNGGYIGKKPPRKSLPDYPLEVLSKFVYQEDKSISKVVAQLNELIDINANQKLSYTPVIQWLKSTGYLLDNFDPLYNKTVTIPSDLGKSIGIRAEERQSMRGVPYLLILYNKQAQEFIVKNMEAILNGEII